MLVYPPGLDFLIAFVSAQYAAAIAVPYYPPIVPASPMPSAGSKKLLADGLQKLARIAQSCEPVLFLSTKMYLRAQWLCSMAVRDAECRWPAEWKWQATDGAAATPVAARDEAWLAAWLVSRCGPADPGEVAFLQYTSGSTGHPKGVMVGTRNLLANIDAIAQMRLCHAEMGSVGVERVGVCSWLPQYHDMGLIGGCLAAAVRGWRADLTSPFTFLQRPLVWLQMFTRLKATHLVWCTAPNFGYALCVRRIKGDALSKLSLSHWLIAMNGAEPIRAQTIQDFSARFAACGFDPRAWAPVFGLAENCLYCCGRAEETVILRVDRARLGVGDRPMPQSGPVETSVLEACGHYILPASDTKQSVRIVHNETCEELADGTVGEIWISGSSVAGGYWQLEDLSNETFRARVKGTTDPTDAPHLRSGDLGFIWERRLYVVGRIKDVLTIKGRTLHAHDIEVCAERGSSMLRPGCCAALPITAEGGEDTLVLMSEIRPEAPTGGAELDEALRSVISEVSESEGVRPSAIVLLKARSILKTTSGKLRRREMRQAYAQLVLGERPAEKWQWLIPESAVVHVWRDSARAAAARPDLAAPAPARQAPEETRLPNLPPHYDGSPLPPAPLSLTAAVEEHARRFRGRRLYSWLRADCSEEATLSFGELREQACSLCVALRRRWGIGTGDRVMLVYPPGLDFLVAFFGAQYAAAIAVPYYPPIVPASPMPSAGSKKLLADGLQKLARIAQSCEPVLFLSTKMYLRAQWLCSMAVRDAECRWPAEWKWQATDGAAATPVAARDEAWLAAWLVSRCGPADPGEVAFLQYTSGSTGHPKGVMVGTRNLLANIDAIAQMRLCHAEMGSVGVERVGVCSWLPQYHDMGLIGGCLAAAVRGWRADLTSPFTFLQRPLVWLQMFTRLKETHLVWCTAPNFGYALCVRRIKGDALSKLSLSHWLIAMNGAEPIRAQTVQDFSARFAACGFDPRAWAPVFGLAENCLYCCGRAEETVILRVDRARLGVGDRPMPQSGPVETSVLEACGHYILPESVTKQSVRIVHNETCEELADGTVGEIWVCGPSVAGGYWQLEDLSNDTFRARVKSTTDPTDAPHLRSGDLGFIWERRLYIVGRIKDVLTIKGRTLHAHDIEVCAERGSSMLRPGCCAALPITAEGGEDTLVLMSEIRPEAPTGGAELDEALRSVISEVSESEGVRPSAIVLLKARSILKTTSGKLRRREMRQAYAQLVLGERPAEKWQWLIPESAVVHVWRDSASAAAARQTLRRRRLPERWPMPLATGVSS